jgi:hypothetical protein
MRAGAFRRLLWTRALPGSVAVFAALTIPEFSVGAGDLGGANGLDDPLDPASNAGQSLGKRVPNAAREPLAGVRYGALIDVRATKMLSAAPTRIADLAPVAISGDEAVVAPIPLAEVRATVSPTPAGAASSRLAETQRAAPAAPAAVDAPDSAATFAALVLEDFAARPGLQAETSLAIGVPATSAALDSLDTAASYAALVIENFVEQPLPRPALSAAVPGLGDDDQQIALLAPPTLPSSAPQCVIAAPTPTSLAAPPAAALAAPAARAMPAGLGKPVTAVPASTLAAQSGATAPAAMAPTALPPAATAPAASRPAPQAAALAPLPKPAMAAPPPGLGNSGPPAFEITSQLLTRVDGKAAGTVDFQQTTTGLAVRLGSIVDVLGDRYDPGEIARIKASAASNLYVPLAELQAQGVPISYDPVYDEFNVGLSDTRPKAARKVHMDQISAPERGLGTTAIDQVPRN